MAEGDRVSRGSGLGEKRRAYPLAVSYFACINTRNVQVIIYEKGRGVQPAEYCVFRRGKQIRGNDIIEPLKLVLISCRFF